MIFSKNTVSYKRLSIISCGRIGVKREHIGVRGPFTFGGATFSIGPNFYATIFHRKVLQDDDSASANCRNVVGKTARIFLILTRIWNDNCSSPPRAPMQEDILVLNGASGLLWYEWCKSCLHGWGHQNKLWLVKLNLPVNKFVGFLAMSPSDKISHSPWERMFHARAHEQFSFSSILFEWNRG